MNNTAQVCREAHSTQNSENRNPEFPGKSPMEDGAPASAKLSRFNRAIRAIKSVLLPVVASGAIAVAFATGAGCSETERGHGPGWDAGHTDSDTYSDTEADTDSSSETGGDVDTDADSDMDSDGDSDTETETDTQDTDTESATESDTETTTDTGECPDTDNSSAQYDDLSFTAEGNPTSFWVTATSDGLGCSLGSIARLRIATADGEFEVNGIDPFIDFEPETRTGKSIILISYSDQNTSMGTCRNGGLQVQGYTLLLLEAQNGLNYVFEFAGIPNGYLPVVYRLEGKEMSIGLYGRGAQAYSTTTGLEEAHAVFPAGVYMGQQMVESVGIGFSSGASSIVSASTSEEAGKAFYRINYESELSNWEVLAAPFSGLEMCGRTDASILAPGDYTYSGAFFSEGDSASVVLKVLKP